MTDLTQYGSCTLDDDGCTTCGDQAIPVRVLERRDHTARCEDQAGQQADIATDFTPEAAPGDVLMVHMGTAIARISEDVL